MDKNILRIFQREIERQCRFAINYPAASSGVLDSLDSGFRRNDELAASGGEYNPKRFKKLPNN
ncbi:MAG: hypothetical protein V2A69_07890 [Pseudomonadota bacterium]